LIAFGVPVTAGIGSRIFAAERFEVVVAEQRKVALLLSVAIIASRNEYWLVAWTLIIGTNWSSPLPYYVRSTSAHSPFTVSVAAED
jgi:hypothetical protein